MGGNTTLASHLGDGARAEAEIFCDFGSGYERFHERLVLTCRWSLHFRKRPSHVSQYEDHHQSK